MNKAIIIDASCIVDETALVESYTRTLEQFIETLCAECGLPAKSDEEKAKIIAAFAHVRLDNMEGDVVYDFAQALGSQGNDKDFQSAYCRALPSIKGHFDGMDNEVEEILKSLQELLDDYSQDTQTENDMCVIVRNPAYENLFLEAFRNGVKKDDPHLFFYVRNTENLVLTGTLEQNTLLVTQDPTLLDIAVERGMQSIFLDGSFEDVDPEAIVNAAYDFVFETPLFSLIPALPPHMPR